ncbi:hypothetical protein RHMOL_Rhmol04G0329600 [Rhododendron molle]|uniref:Uncharacterized protein n=1 Tax=Rhododendron molle TaxID=49168 RepID=A0ACC0P831_RHOML|nr:hypothetical protein RHMOL_Rhmol04G0329600 [Rhododendron molle]
MINFNSYTYDMTNQLFRHSEAKEMSVFLARRTPMASIPSERVSKPVNDYKLQSRSHVRLPSQETSSHRRHVLVFTSVSLVPNLTFDFLPLPLFAWAGEKAKSEDDKDEGVIEAVKSLFDPNEKTKSGKVLPKAYLKSARELVRTLRDSLKEDPKDLAKFRRTADAAKESIREYLNGWRGQNTVAKEESYVVLEKAIRSLASFYSKAGPSAPLPEEVKLEILSDLKTAEDFL